MPAVLDEAPAHILVLLGWADTSRGHLAEAACCIRSRRQDVGHSPGGLDTWHRSPVGSVLVAAWEMPEPLPSQKLPEAAWASISGSLSWNRCGAFDDVAMLLRLMSKGAAAALQTEEASHVGHERLGGPEAPCPRSRSAVRSLQGQSQRLARSFARIMQKQEQEYSESAKRQCPHCVPSSYSYPSC